MKRFFPVLVLAAVSTALAAQAPVGAGFGPSSVGGPEYQGDTIAARVPAADQMTNIGSRLDGAGMCVDTSVETQARYLGMDEWRGFRDHFAAAERGGNYPEGLVRQIAAWAKLKKLPAPRYVQYVGPDPGPILELAARTHRGAAVTYGYSPRYGSAINHMVFSPLPQGKAFAAVMDNNVFGGLTKAEDRRYEWMANEEFVLRNRTSADRRGRAVLGDGWVFSWLEPPPPPSPKPFPAE